MLRYVTCHQATLGSLPQVTPQIESRSTGRPTEHREPFRTTQHTQHTQDVQETFSNTSPLQSPKHIHEKPAWPVVPGAGSQQIHPASKDQFQLSAKTAGLCCMHTRTLIFPGFQGFFHKIMTGLHRRLRNVLRLDQ